MVVAQNHSFPYGALLKLHETESGHEGKASDVFSMEDQAYKLLTSTHKISLLWKKINS